MREANTVVLPLSDYNKMKEDIERLNKFVEEQGGFIVISTSHSNSVIGYNFYSHSSTSYQTRDEVISKLAEKITNTENELRRVNSERDELNDSVESYRRKIEQLESMIACYERKKWWQIWR